VGKYKDPISNMRGTKGGSRYAMPLDAVPERGQLLDHISHPPSKQRCHVFQQYPSGLEQSNHANDFPKETAPRARDTGSLARIADVLARKPGTNKVNGPIVWIAHKPDARHGRRERANVGPLPNVRPVLLQNLPCIVVNLHLPNCFESTSPFEAKFDTTDAREQGANREWWSVEHCRGFRAGIHGGENPSRER